MTPQRVHTDERGATAVLVGVLLPVLLAVSALGVGTLAVSGGERELQRAADAAALGTASRLPVVDVGSAPGLADLKPGLGLIDGAGCAIVDDNLARAPMTRAFGGDTTCSAEVQPFGLQLSQALQAGLDVLPNHRGNLDPLLRNVNIPALLPGIATPYVEVTARNEYDAPLRGLISPGQPVEIEATAVARRRIKNAVLVPATDASVVCDGTKRTLLLLKQSFTDETLGTVLDLLEDVSLGLLSSVTVDECTFDANQTLEIPRDPALETLDQLADVVESTDELELIAPAIRELRLDLADVYDPPTGGDVPTQQDLIDAAAADEEDVLVILANPISGGGGLLSGLIGASAVPILDVAAVPASCLADGELTVEHLVSVDDSNPCVRAIPQGRGLFRATLVEKGPGE